MEKAVKPGRRQPTKLELAYCAGFFDGEGTVAISLPQGTSLYLLTCSITNTDIRPLNMFKKLFGGSVKGPYQRKSEISITPKPVFMWNADAAKAESFLRLLLPFLVLKRERAEKGIAFRDLFKGANVLPRGKADLSDPRHANKRSLVLSQRRSAYEEMRRLNKRGVVHVGVT